jgi:hypothetical protein
MNPAIPRAQPAPLDIIGTQIRADAHGRYSLNDLHRASGGAKKHQPSDFLRTSSAKGLTDALNAEPGNPGAVEKARGGSAGGSTFVRRELVIAYAMWIDATFMLKVIRAFDGLLLQAQHEAAIQHQQLAQLALALQGGKREASLCGKVLGKWGKRRRTLVERIDALERVLQLTLDGIEPAAASTRLQ